MKGRLGKFGFILLALALCLSISGAAFAHWSDNVNIEGTVEMGDFLVGWEGVVACSDNEDMNVPIKDVASVNCSLQDPETGVHHTPVQTVYHTLVMEVTSAYPQYNATCTVDIKNAGTIPAHIVNITVTPGAGLSVGAISRDTNGNPVDWELIDVDTSLPALDLVICKNLTGLSLVCNQLEPCTAEPVDVSIEVKQEGVEECNTYNFSVTITAVQWNKA